MKNATMAFVLFATGFLVTLGSCGFFDDRTVQAVRDVLVDRAEQELADLLLPILAKVLGPDAEVTDDDRDLVLRAVVVLAELRGSPTGIDHQTKALLIEAGLRGAVRALDDFNNRRDRYRAMLEAAVLAGEVALEQR